MAFSEVEAHPQDVGAAVQQAGRVADFAGNAIAQVVQGLSKVHQPLRFYVQCFDCVPQLVNRENFRHVDVPSIWSRRQKAGAVDRGRDGARWEYRAGPIRLVQGLLYVQDPLFSAGS